jgi:beta-glucosidase/6-phospho-beta-glucosidase/beta-galactosidase
MRAVPLEGRADSHHRESCAAEDLVAEDAAIYDTDRIMFLRNNLTQLERAVADGVPVKATFNGA